MFPSYSMKSDPIPEGGSKTDNRWLIFLNFAKDFFYRDNSYFYLSYDLGEFIESPVAIQNFKDIIDYRTRRFYKERLEKLER